jgi:hypothetical protein
MTGLRTLAGLAAAALFCTGVAGCTRHDNVEGISTGHFQLVAFDSCQDAVDGLRAAAKAVVGPYGFTGPLAYAVDSTGRGLPVPAPAAAPGAAQGAAPNAAANGASDAKSAGTAQMDPDYSGTNTHESGVDEPDLVKTDGHRIVTVSRGQLKVVDADRKVLTATLNLIDGTGPASYYMSAIDMLLAGDHALLLVNNYAYDYGTPIPLPAGAAGANGGVVQSMPVRAPFIGTSLILVDLNGGARVLSRAQVDGNLIDARQVDSTVRVVIRSTPRINFPSTYDPSMPSDARVAANQAAIDATPIDAWVPRIDVTTNGVTRQTAVDCNAISYPPEYSGTSMLTVLTFDLGAQALGDGVPTSVLADGDTVYSNGPSLYVASNQSWRQPWMKSATPADFRTEIYKFDTPANRRPVFVAGGSVPGHLINQYAMSEWDGKLRVASQVDATWADSTQQKPSESGVHVLAVSGNQLREVGSVEGLGLGERIYSVRFAGPVGYVVTFRQTDPLYALDLGDPTHPVVRGTLKISGYSAYLHPTDGDRLIGVGQDATDAGRVTGLQVSLFDVGDLSKPSRIAQYKASGTHSEAEFDPHAFLYWPKDGLLVVPVTGREIGAIVLHVGGGSLDEVGFVSHPRTSSYPTTIRRSLIIDTTLWTVSDAGLLASDSNSLARLAWISFA